MEFKVFEEKFFNNLKNQNNQCIDDISINQDIIKKYLCDEGENSYVKEFVEKLNDCILHYLNNVILINKILQNELFEMVLSVFRESDILLRSCIEIIDEKIVKWILSMNTNPYHLDKNGMNALMYAAKSPKLVFVVQHFIDTNNEKVLYHVDNNGENVLFHSVYNLAAFQLLIKTSIDVNHQNNHKETVLIHCSKHEDARYAIPFLSNHPQLDPNIPDEEGMNAPLYLVEKGSHRQLLQLKNIDMNFRYKKTDDNIMSLLFKKLYNTRDDPSYHSLVPYLSIFRNFIDKKMDLNVPIDKDGNTPLMYFIMIYDKVSIYYFVTHYPNLDINVKNKYGEDAILLCIKLDYFEIIDFLLKKRHYKYDCDDEHHNNILMYWSLKNYISKIEKTVKVNRGFLTKVNDNNETPLIVATKLGNLKAVHALLKYKEVRTEINHQDILGNTALYYAIEIEEDAIVNSLLFHHADSTIKNNKDQSPMELAEEIGNEVILNLIEEPVVPEKYESKSFQEKFSSFTHKTKSLVKIKGKKATNINDPNFNIDLHFKSKYQTIYGHSMNNIKSRPYQPFPGDNKKFIKFLYCNFYNYSTSEYEEALKFVGEFQNMNAHKGIKRINTGIKIFSLFARFII